MFVFVLEYLIATDAIYSFAFSYEDYLEPNVHSARMPLRYAVRDAIGVKDVIMDSLDTLRGSQFNYRSFEPSEGVPHIGSSRTSRIMAGLRYSTSTAKKHWLEPAPASHFIASSVRGAPHSEGNQAWEEQEDLEFEDPDPAEEVEKLYASSRKMLFGDYNFPVIDFTAPLYRRGGSYGAVGQSNNLGSSTVGNRPSIANMNKYTSSMDTVLAQREGCVDVIVERGRGNYVLNYQSNKNRTADAINAPSKVKSPVEAKRKALESPSTSRLRDSRPLTVAPNTISTSTESVRKGDVASKGTLEDRNYSGSGSGSATPRQFYSANSNANDSSTDPSERSPFLDNDEEESHNVWRNGWS